MSNNHSLLVSTTGGTLLSMAPQLSTILVSDVVKTALLAAVGATVSFTLSLLLRHLVQRFKRK